MPNHTKFDHLTYFETSTAQEYTNKPQGALDVVRLTRGKTDFWQKLTPAGHVKKKNLILADWWAENWDPWMCIRVKVLLAELLGEGFNVYVWQDPHLKLLDDIKLLDDKNWRRQIKPEFKDVLTAQAMAQLKLPNDKLAILQRVELEGLLGRTPEESKTINALYLIDTRHSIKKIKAVEASQSITFDKALLGEPCSMPLGEIKNKLNQNWKNVELTKNYQVLKLSNHSKIYLNEVNHVCVDILSKKQVNGREYEIKQTHQLANSPSYLSLDLEALDSNHPASVLEQLLTPELKGLEIINYPVGDTPLDINPENLVNLEYLSLSRSCPPEIGLAIVKTSKLRNLVLNARNYLFPEEKIENIAYADDQHFTQLNSLTLINCNSTALQYLFYSEMPELNSLTLCNTLFDKPFKIRHSLNKLKSLKISGSFDAQDFESLIQSAPNCNQLDLALSYVWEDFSPGLHLPKVTSLSLGGLSLEDTKACAATESIIKAASALTMLKIQYDLSGYSFMDAVHIPQVRSLTLCDNDEISAQTLRPILKGITDLDELTIEDFYECQWDEELSCLLSNIGKIHMSFDDNSIKHIDQIQDMPRLESIQLFGDDSEGLAKNIDNLFKSASRLKALLINFCDNINFIDNVSFPDTVESLDLTTHGLSAEDFKKILIAMPKLRSLSIILWRDKASNVKEWQADTELQELLGKIENVTLPNTYYELVEYSTKSNSDGGYTTYESNIGSEVNTTLPHPSEQKRTSSIPPKRDSSKPISIDADTTPVPNTSFNLTHLFNATSGDNHPSPSHYRLGTYNQLLLSDKPGIKEPFILENTGDLDLMPCKLIPVADVFKLGKELTHGGYFGKQTLRLDSTWQPIASLSTMDHISHVSGNYQNYEINYSKRDNLYYIRSKTGEQTITLDFLVKSPTGPSPVITNPDIQEWITMFRAFGVGELKLTSKNPTSQQCLDALLEQKVGSCRHRSMAFKALMAQKYPELQVRIVENDCHMFVEMMQGEEWIRCDFGGYPAALNINEMTPDQDNTSSKSKITRTEMCYVSEQQREFEQHFETWAIGRDPRADNAKRYVQGVLNGRHKKQLIHVPADDIAALNIAIQTQAIDTSHPVFYIHSPDELVCSAPFVSREGNQGKLCSNPDGGGPLHNFLTASRDNTTNSPILIVNYAGFSADDIVRFNGLLDEIRHADGTPLPKDTVVIGLIDPDKPGAYNGADFYSRFDTVEQCPLTTIPLMAPVLNTITEQNKPESAPIQINLCHASNWMTQLMGSWTLQHGKLYFEEGQLISALESGRPIEIQNPPTDSAFDIFWQQARLRQSIEYAGVSYPFSERVQCFSREGYDWQEVKHRIVWSNITPSNARVLNPLNLSEFSVQYQFDEDGLFTRAPGL